MALPTMLMKMIENIDCLNHLQIFVRERCGTMRGLVFVGLFVSVTVYPNLIRSIRVKKPR